MSWMALIKRGGSGSERSRHINIRHFWLSEKVAGREVVLENMGTQESEYDRRMIVVNPDRPFPFGCRNYHVLKSGHIQLISHH